MKDTVAALGVTIIVVAFTFILALFYSREERNKELDFIRSDMNTYYFMIVNGEVYNTDDIKDIDLRMRSYNEGIVTFVLNDGTKVYAPIGSYTFTNSKEK